MSHKGETDLVSVVICAYNNWPDLEITIASALHQSYPLIEVIVVDNSSTDATQQEVPSRFGASVRYIRQGNRECAGAYNAGLAVAQGEFVQFVDGDDVLAPNKIQKQLEVFSANPQLDIVYGDVRTFQTSAGVANWTDVTMVAEDDMLGSLTAPHGIWLNTLGVLFRRAALERVGPWDETLYIEDADYFLRAAWAGCHFGHCPDSPMGFKRLRRGQKTEDFDAMECGQDAVWKKALGYITREPYRGMLAARIAEYKLRRVVFREKMPRRQALIQLKDARSLSPNTISRLTYLTSCIAVILPGGRSFVRIPWLTPTRRILARLLNFQAASTSEKHNK